MIPEIFDKNGKAFVELLELYKSQNFKNGDKVLFKKEYRNYHLLLKRRAYDYFLISKIMPHSQRIGGFGYRITLPNGEFVVNASSTQLLHYKNS